MTKQMLRGIRVKSRDELIERIYKYINEINTEPVVYHFHTAYELHFIPEGNGTLWIHNDSYTITPKTFT